MIGSKDRRKSHFFNDYRESGPRFIVLAAGNARVMSGFIRPKAEGAGKAGCEKCTRSLACKMEEARKL
jgi:NAD(P)-dependent dehydrogenase (short-subunit alcohol dehydrogenase family)